MRLKKNNQIAHKPIIDTNNQQIIFAKKTDSNFFDEDIVRPRAEDSDDEEEVRFDDDVDENQNMGLFDGLLYGGAPEESQGVATADADVQMEDIPGKPIEKKERAPKGTSSRAKQQARYIAKLNKRKQEFEGGMKPKLQRLVTGLGELDGNVFYQSADCVMMLQRIREAIENDDANRTVWKQLAEWKLLQNELMSIIACNRRYSPDNDNEELLFEALSLMVTLTDPPKKLSDMAETDGSRVGFKNEEAFHLREQYRILQEMKLGFLLRDSVMSLVETLLPSDNAVQDNNFLLETKQSSHLLSYEEYTMLVIQLFVNLLKIPDGQRNVLSSTDQISQMQEMFIKQLDKARMLQFFNAVVQKLFVKYDVKARKNLLNRRKLNSWYFLCLEFLCLITMDETPETLFEADRLLNRPAQRSVSAAKKSTAPKANAFNDAILKKLLETEDEQTKQHLVNAPSRHSRFGGVFISRVNTPSERQQIDPADPTKTKTVIQPAVVKITKKVYTGSDPLAGKDVVNERQLCVRETLRHPKFSWLTSATKKILKDFFNVFFKHSFNMFFERIWDSIKYLKEDLELIATQSFHEANILYLGAFMLDFNRQVYEYHVELNQRLTASYTKEAKFDISSIASIIELPDMICDVLDRVVDQAYETKNWNALNQISYFMKEFVMIIDRLFTVPDYLSIASALLHKLLYEPKRINVIPRMIRIFNPHVLPRGYLVNLVELSHTLLKVLEAETEKGVGNFYIKKRKVTRRKKGEVKKAPDAYEYQGSDDEEEVVVEKQDFEQQNQFSLDAFKLKFANRGVVSSYLLLLEDYAINPPHVNEHILQMFIMLCDKEKANMHLLFFNVLTLSFFSKVLTKKHDLYPKDKSTLLMTDRERVNKKLVDFILSLICTWRTTLTSDSPFSKHLHVEAWFNKTTQGINILKGIEEEDEAIYDDDERKSRRKSKRRGGLSSEAFSEAEDMLGFTDAGEDIPVRNMNLDDLVGDRPGLGISMEEGEEEYDFDSQPSAPVEESSEKKKKKKRNNSGSEEEETQKPVRRGRKNMSNKRKRETDDEESDQETASKKQKKEIVYEPKSKKRDKENEEPNSSTLSQNL